MTITSCAICAYPITEQHHIVPRGYGGGDDAENLVRLCPNHHAAIHVALKQMEWEVLNRSNETEGWKRLAPLDEKHQRLYAAIYQDSALMDYVRTVVVQRFTEADWPFHVPLQRKNRRSAAEFDAAATLYEEQKAWEARKQTVIGLA